MAETLLLLASETAQSCAAKVTVVAAHVARGAPLFIRGRSSE